MLDQKYCTCLHQARNTGKDTKPLSLTLASFRPLLIDGQTYAMFGSQTDVHMAEMSAILLH